LGLGICSLALGFAVLRHYLGEGALAFLVATVVGLIVAAVYLLWLRKSLLLRRRRPHR
jgi:O-antigen/teichoic acid export membrane protein